jgi:hypothetical protein
MSPLKIVAGPKIPIESAFPPYGTRCDDLVMRVDESQVDDYVPRIYVESNLKLISGYACYTAEAARGDLETLKALPFLESVSVAYGSLKPPCPTPVVNKLVLVGTARLFICRRIRHDVKSLSRADTPSVEDRTPKCPIPTDKNSVPRAF